MMSSFAADDTNRASGRSTHRRRFQDVVSKLYGTQKKSPEISAQRFLQVLTAKRRNTERITTREDSQQEKKLFSNQAELEMLYKHHNQNATQTNAGMARTTGEFFSSRKESSSLLEFVSGLSQRIRQDYRTALTLQSQMLEDLFKFTSEAMLRLMKPERRDFHDILVELLDVRSTQNIVQNRLQQNKMDNHNSVITCLEKETQDLRTQVAELQAELESYESQPKGQQKKATASPEETFEPADKSPREKGGEMSASLVQQVGTQPTEPPNSMESPRRRMTVFPDNLQVAGIGSMMNTATAAYSVSHKSNLETLKLELQMANKRFEAKERDHIGKLNMMQQKIGKLKTINLGLVEKYNAQTEKLNRFKHRLIFHIRKIDPNAEVMNDDDVIDGDFLRAMEQNSTASGEEQSNGAVFEGVQEHNQNKKNKNAQGGMFAIEQQDKFDYNVIYRRRHIWKKSHSQKKNPKAFDVESKHVKYYKSYVRTTTVVTDTRGLVPLQEGSTQTVLSLADKRYDPFLNNQYDVELLAKRNNFEREIEQHLQDHRRMCFLTDGLMRKLLLLSPPKSEGSPDNVPLEHAELVVNLKNHDIDFHISEEEYNQKLKIANIDSYFSPERLDEYMDHKLRLPFAATDTILKYVFLSYIFATLSNKKKLETIQRKEEQVAVLFKICKQYKQKLAEYDIVLKRSQEDFQSFIQIHRGCGISHITGDFRFEKMNTVGSVDLTHVSSHSATISSIINRIKKLKSVMKVTNKKYFSFKVIYQKVHSFFINRSSEVEFFYDSNQVKHAHKIDEHFFRYFTDKESGVKKIEEKIKNFIITVYNMEYNPKIDMLMRFLNLSKEMPFTKSEEYFYLRLIEFIKSESRGLEIPPDVHRGINFIPVEKLEVFLTRNIMWKIGSKAQANIFQAMKREIVTNFEGVSKKGVIDIDVAMLIVFRYMNTKGSYTFPMEYSFSLFDILDIHNQESLDFSRFLEMYRLFNLNYYGEATRLLGKVKGPKLKTALTMTEMFDVIGAQPDNSLVEKPWMEKNYIYSLDQLKEIFCKYTKQPFKEGEEPTGKLEIYPFHEMINEYENLFDFNKIYSFLGIDGAHIEAEFFSNVNNFHRNRDSFASFIDTCMIENDDWKDMYRRKLGSLQFIFENSAQFEEAIKTYSLSLVRLNLDKMTDDKRRTNVMLKYLLIYKMFQMELLKVDFEQRFDHVQLEELPFD